MNRCWACGNYRLIKEEVVKQVLLTREPLDDPWEIGEFKCDNPCFPLLTESDLPENIHGFIEFYEGNQFTLGHKKLVKHF